MSRTALLFLIIFLEGYAVLSVELLAIRLTVPFVGSGTDTVAIIISAVLMPLAFGYYAGGKFRGRVRKKLLRNLLLAAAVLTIGLSFFCLNGLFMYMIQKLGWHNRLALTTFYALVFLIYPVYLLGQTVPLISNYFTRARLPHAAGRILFFSTVGSFFGAVFSSLLLMNTVGVHYTAAITIVCLAVLVFILTKKKLSLPPAAAFLLALGALGLNSDALLAKLDVVHSNAYSTIQIKEFGNERVTVRDFRLNGARSSAIFTNKDDTVFRYAKYVEDNLILPLLERDQAGRILILGAGGFTLGRHDRDNEYVFVDIDPDLKDVAEEKFLEGPIGKNKTFIPLPARAFLNQNKEPFDLIIVDLGRGLTGAPEHLLTKEFFAQVKAHVKTGGIVAMNYSLPAIMDDVFSVRLDNTIRSVFPHINRQVMGGFKPWQEGGSTIKNVLYIGRIYDREDMMIYSDNINRSGLDKKTELTY